MLLMEIKPDYSKLVADCIIHLGREWSLEQYSRKANVNKSSIYSWCKRRTRPSWHHFFRILQMKNDKIDASIWRGIPAENGNSIIKKFIDENTFNEVALVSGMTRDGLNKLLEKDSEPKVETIFMIWDHFSRYNFLCFLYSLVKLSGSDWFDPISKKWDLEIKLSTRHPYFAGVIMSFGDGVAYKDLDKKLSNKFNIEVHEISLLIDALLKNDFAQLNCGVIKLSNNYYFNSSIHYPTYKKLTLYWSNQALKQFSEQEEPSNISCNYALLRLNDLQYQEIQKDINQLYVKARALSEKSHSPEDALTTLTLQFLKMN